MLENKKTKIGIIGCGNISRAYLSNAPRFDDIEIVACADLVMDKAKAKAKEYGIKAVSVDELLADPEIEIVVNLTIPQAHCEVALKALEAGKSVYNEKPLAVTRADGQRILDAAKIRGLRVGCAPDTFLGAGIQTCIKLINEGTIGEPVASTAFMMCHGHESWHPDPEFYYKAGGGPMFDMGPYYLTALVAMMGPVNSVTGSARKTFAERMITSEPKNGTKIEVDVPTHVVGVMNFASGAIGTIITSFDVWGADLPRIEIYGTKGSLSVPDPNCFGGPVRILRAGESEWQDVPLAFDYAEESRIIGVADMSRSINLGTPHKASGAMAYHVLDIMHAFHDASQERRNIELTSTCDALAKSPT